MQHPNSLHLIWKVVRRPVLGGAHVSCVSSSAFSAWHVRCQMDVKFSPRFDSSGDGKLSFHEFVAALAIMIRGTEDRNKLLVSRVCKNKIESRFNRVHHEFMFSWRWSWFRIFVWNHLPCCRTKSFSWVSTWQQENVRQRISPWRSHWEKGDRRNRREDEVVSPRKNKCKNDQGSYRRNQKGGNMKKNTIYRCKWHLQKKQIDAQDFKKRSTWFWLGPETLPRNHRAIHVNQKGSFWWIFSFELRLIHACKGLTSSLVATADDTSEKDQIYHDLSDLTSFSTKLEIGFLKFRWLSLEFFAVPFVFGRTWSDCSTKLLEIKMEPFPSKRAEMWKDEEMMLRCDATIVSLRNANCWGDDIRDVQGSFSKRCQHVQEQLLRTRRTHCCQKHGTSTWRRGRFLLCEAAVQHEEFLMALGIVHRGCNWVEKWSHDMWSAWELHILIRCSWKDWMEGVREWWYVSWWRCHWTPPQISTGKTT